MALEIKGTKVDNTDVLVSAKTEVDMFRLTASKSDNGTDITANLERCDDASFSKIGTGMTESSGIFTFPRTGVYKVTVQANITGDSADSAAVVQTDVTTNNSTYDGVAYAAGGDDGGSGTHQTTAFSQCFVNVTDTSNVKVKFQIYSFASGSQLNGDTDLNKTCFAFERLGDSQ
tara:strand:- start:1232 stop:1753 length:522 start_codon:yes stop_codon:yes gene_type:complete